MDLPLLAVGDSDSPLMTSSGECGWSDVGLDVGVNPSLCSVLCDKKTLSSSTVLHGDSESKTVLIFGVGRFLLFCPLEWKYTCFGHLHFIFEFGCCCIHKC